LHLLLDVGMRIQECISLRRENLDLENLLIDISGKGGKFRRIPISPQCRKILYTYLRSHEFPIVFPTNLGLPVEYSNVRKDFKRLCKRLGITVDGSFHALRRYWASFAARRGLSPFLIQRNLGHSSITMTQRYIR